MSSASIGTSVKTAKKLLEDGSLVAIPTETVYGLAGNALHATTVAKIFEVKNRPYFDPLIVHVPSIEEAKNYVTEVPLPAKNLALAFWPGPLTLLLPKKTNIPDLVTAGLDRVGLRCPDHQLTRELLHLIDFPLAAPSANPFGYVSPTTAQHVMDQLGEKISYILDGGPCKIGIESTIVGWENAQAIVYRLGGITIDQIESVIGKVHIQAHSSSSPQTSGQLQNHYAPSHRFLLGNVQHLVREHRLQKPGVLTFQKIEDLPGASHLVLSPAGDLNEAARNLFGMLRQLDNQDIDSVVAEEVPNVGIGRAINDRLRRAAATG